MLAQTIQRSLPMHPAFFARGDSLAVPVTFVTAATWPEQRAELDSKSRAYAEAAGFEPKAGRHLLLPAPDGALAGVLFADSGIIMPSASMRVLKRSEWIESFRALSNVLTID